MICFALANFQHHTRTWCRFPPSCLPCTVQRELTWRALATAMSLLRMSSIHTSNRSYSRELSDSVKKSSIHRRVFMCCRYAADMLPMCWSRNLAARDEIKCQIQSLLPNCRNYNICYACCSRHIHIYILLYLCICMWEYINVNCRERSFPSDLLKYDVKSQLLFIEIYCHMKRGKVHQISFTTQTSHLRSRIRLCVTLSDTENEREQW